MRNHVEKFSNILSSRNNDSHSTVDLKILDESKKKKIESISIDKSPSDSLM